MPLTHEMSSYAQHPAASLIPRQAVEKGSQWSPWDGSTFDTTAFAVAFSYCFLLLLFYSETGSHYVGLTVWPGTHCPGIQIAPGNYLQRHPSRSESVMFTALPPGISLSWWIISTDVQVRGSKHCWLTNLLYSTPVNKLCEFLHLNLLQIQNSLGQSHHLL